MAIAGHVSRETLTHCAPIRMEAKRRALEAIATMPASAGARVVTKKVLLHEADL